MLFENCFNSTDVLWGTPNDAQNDINQLYKKILEFAYSFMWYFKNLFYVGQYEALLKWLCQLRTIT